MSRLCPKCGSDVKISGGKRYSSDGDTTYRYYKCTKNPSHKFKTIEIMHEDAINIDKSVTELIDTVEDCPFCCNGEQNQLLNSETFEDTDLEVYIGRLGDALRVKHYDIEGDTYDTRDTVLINFCPMCGRSLKK